MGALVAVIGCNGGIGSSTFAAALAQAAGSGTLVDLDAAGGGIDVLLGIAREPGARWSDVEVDGGRIDPDTLAARLPRWDGCPVLAADTDQLDPDVVLRALGAAAASGPVAVDLPRNDCAERAAGLLQCDVVVLLARSDAVGIAAAHAVADGLPELPVGLVLRRGPADADGAASALGLPLIGSLSHAVVPVRGRCVPRDVAAVAKGVLAGLVGAGEAA